MKESVFVADLTHTNNGIMAMTFPLGAASVASYARETAGDAFTFELFKFPEKLAQRILARPPRILALSNYCWNLELGYKLAAWAKARDPGLIVVFGGPNFPILSDEKKTFLRKRPVIDFHIENEGEIGFSELLKSLYRHGFDPAAVKKAAEPVANCCYLDGDALIEGGVQRITDLDILPSPYLGGMLDEFFGLPLVPLMETTRGCPFSCTFCADGLASKNKVIRFKSGRVRSELDYIARRIRNIHELHIADLNFGMYQQDIETARAIAEIRKKYDWPSLIIAATGKNQQERVIETARLLDGSWVLGSSIQSSDPDVLRKIKRSNISTAAYGKFMDFMNSQNRDIKTQTEIILALPGDTLEKHFASLRYGVENGTKFIKMFQALLLVGTEMASRETRDRFQLLTKFRIIPGSIGLYRFGDERIPVAEIEEIIVGSKDMPFRDYLSCRVMNLLIETYYSGSLCEEVFATLKAMGLPPFDALTYLFRHDELYSSAMRNVISRFVEASQIALYDSHEEAEASALSAEQLPRYLAGELGANELLGAKGALYAQFEDTLAVLVRAVKMFLTEKGLLTDRTGDYFDQLRDFILCRKRDMQDVDLETARSFHFDFAAIAGMNYAIHPEHVEASQRDLPVRFFHTPTQKTEVRDVFNFYRNHPGGVGRLLYEQNTKRFYRSFEPLGGQS